MKTALLPYPAYKPSGGEWLGDVPAHWEVVRTKQAFKRIVGGSTPLSSEPSYWDGEIVWVTPTDINKQSRLNDSLRRITKNGLDNCSTQIVPAGSIVISCRAPVGNISFAKVPLCTNQGCKALVPRNQVIESEYAFRLFSVLREELQSRANGTTFTEISTVSLGKVLVSLPPLPEQRAIARYLDHADRPIQRYIEAKEQLIARLQEARQSIIQRAVTRGLDPDAPFKPSGLEWLGEVPAHWEVRRAKFLYREVKERSNTGTEELMSVSHKTGVTPRKKNVTMFRAETNVGYKLCSPGDIVINTMWAYMAALGVARQVGLVSPSYNVYRPIDAGRLNPDYIDPLLRTETYRSEYLVRSTGITVSRLRLYPDSFLDIPLLYPPVEEQAAIAAHLDQATAQIDAAIDNARRQSERMAEYRASLIAHVVTGKLDVRAAAERTGTESS